jgi:plastocyanin
VRRAALAAVAVFAVLAAADLGGGTSAAAAQPSGSATDNCAMHRHGKRVVRQVRRHGKLRTVRRTRHWWTCEPASPQPAPAASAPSPDSVPAPAGPPPAASHPAPPPGPEPELEPGPTHLSVKAAEYSYVLSRQTLDAGEVTIELDNRGQDAHNLNLQPVEGEEAPLEIAETESLRRRASHFTLQPGTYRLWCSLPAHDEEGMHATLVVAAP